MTTTIDILKNEKAILAQKFGVEELGIFGSFARGEDKPDSDIDILVSIKIKTLENYIGLLDYLQSKLHKKVDLVTKHKRLSDRFLNIINKDIIYV